MLWFVLVNCELSGATDHWKIPLSITGSICKTCGHFCLLGISRVSRVSTVTLPPQRR